MSDQRLYALLEQLYKKTVDGRLAWETTVDEGIYQVSFPKHSIKIAQLRSCSDYIVTVHNEEGVLIDSIATWSLSKNDLASDKVNRYREMMEEIYEKARRTALHVDQALDELLDVLEKR